MFRLFFADFPKKLGTLGEPAVSQDLLGFCNEVLSLSRDRDRATGYSGYTHHGYGKAAVVKSWVEPRKSC
jgi:hypothetical protein